MRESRVMSSRFRRLDAAETRVDKRNIEYCNGRYVDVGINVLLGKELSTASSNLCKHSSAPLVNTLTKPS